MLLVPKSSGPCRLVGCAVRLEQCGGEESFKKKSVYMPFDNKKWNKKTKKITRRSIAMKNTGSTGVFLKYLLGIRRSIVIKKIRITGKLFSKEGSLT